ncbi:MAG TPA: hypothetical protein VLZ11_05065 [Flavobacterium sp.]|nr:hypothetical protein [Flavobacterium sp.]
MLLGAFIITGCSSDEISESEISNHILKREGTLDLSKDEDFIELYNLFSEYAEVEKDIEQITYFISKIEREKNLSNKDMELFAQSMGYENKEQALEYTQRFFSLAINLDNKYNISNIRQNELDSIFITGFEGIETSSDDCARRQRNCFAKAAGIATVAHIGCAALDITVILGMACHAGVTLVWVAANDDCKLDYKDCMNPN